MKRFLLINLLLILTVLTKAQNPDLPNPNPNLQTLPQGSYVIAMDNTLQVTSSGDFNLKAYGLIVYLLNNNVKIKWSIKTGKSKDDIDFTAMAEQISPGLVPGGISRNFKAGPFVIDAADTSGVSALIDAYNSSNSLSVGNRSKVYRLTTAVSNVDIRYDLAGFIPRAAILTDGGNQNIHLAYMTSASIPTSNYTTSTGTGLLANCFTFASEPHNDKSGTAVNDAISAIKNFVMNGGNFLAQCAAVDNYENNPLGRFQTTGGITIANTNIGTTLAYPNPDLSFSQFEGAYNASSGGSVKNWKIIGSPSNNEHDHATGTGTNAGIIGASVSKMAIGKGGLVFYIGNHSFPTNTAAGINGIRMYMNALLTPTNTCPSMKSSIVLPVRLINFAAVKQDQSNKLKWAIEENQTAKEFEIERSVDGKDFVTCGFVFATGSPGHEDYSFSEHSTTGKVFYRIRMIDEQGIARYSTIVSINIVDAVTNNGLTIVNPVKSNLIFNYTSRIMSTITVNVYNSSGTPVYSTRTNCFEGRNQVSIPANYLKTKGVYAIEVIDSKTLTRNVSKAFKI